MKRLRLLSIGLFILLLFFVAFVASEKKSAAAQKNGLGSLQKIAVVHN